MSDEGYKLSENAVRELAGMLNGWRSQKRNRDGTLVPPIPLMQGFWARITDNQSNNYVSGSNIGAPFLYSWVEQYATLVSGKETLTDKSMTMGGRFGTKNTSGGASDLGPAYNVWEYGPLGLQNQPVPNGTYVWIEVGFDDQSPASAVWRFDHTPTSDVIVQITGTDTGDAQYIGNVIGGATSAVSGTAFSLPGGMSTGVAALICNLDEQGLTGHRVKQCFLPGKLMGWTSAGSAIVFVHGGVGSVIGSSANQINQVPGLSGFGASWSRSGTPGGTQLMLYGTVWNPSTSALEGVGITITLDARGMVTSIAGGGPPGDLPWGPSISGSTEVSFTGTLAAAVSAGKNVQNGIILK
jgi:hypothetical protein